MEMEKAQLIAEWKRLDELREKCGEALHAARTEEERRAARHKYLRLEALAQLAHTQLYNFVQREAGNYVDG